MGRLPHLQSQGACYFVTIATIARRRLFDDPENCRILAGIIYNLRASRGFLLAGFVIMPDHLHIALLPTGGLVEEIVKEVKRGSTRLINMRSSTSGALWQRDYWDRGVGSESELMQKIRYMLANPQRAGLVNGQDVYSWSSANPSFVNDLESILGY